MTKQRQNIKILSQINKVIPTDKEIGVTGILDSSGNLVSDPQLNLPGAYIWVRRNRTGQAIRALNPSVKMQAGLEVYIERPSITEEWVVTGLTPEGIRQLGAWAPSYSVPDIVQGVGRSLVSPEQISILRAAFIGDFNVEISNGNFIMPDGSTSTLSSGVIDISSHQPAGPNEKALVLIGLDLVAGSLTSQADSAVASTKPPQTGMLFSRSAIKTFINTASASYPDVFWLYAVSMKDSDTELNNIKRIRNVWFIPHTPLQTPRYGVSETLIIATGEITLNVRRNIIVAAESGTADDLDTINGLSEGEEVVLRADSGDTITVKHGTGNIETDAGTDISLTGNKILKLLSIDGTTLRQYA